MPLKDEIKVSVIVPVYNVENYLDECLRSVLIQKFSDYEIICIDDASPDNSINILNRYQEKYSQIRVIHHEVNLGLSAARNSGIKAAKGEYIFFLDSDDMLAHENVLGDLYHQVNENRLDVLLFEYQKRRSEDMLQTCDYQRFSANRTVYDGKRLFCLLSLENRVKVGMCRLFVKKDFLLSERLFFYEGIIHEDVLFFLFSVLHAERIMETQEICYLYRQHSNSIMTTYDSRRFESMFIVLSEIYSYWKEKDFSEENQAMKKYVKGAFGAYKKYRNYVGKNTDLRYGTPAEKYMYQLLREDAKPCYTAKQIKQFVDSERVIVYGAGAIAADVIYFLRNLEIEIDYIAVSKKKDISDDLYGISVKEISELVEYKDKSTIALAVNDKNASEIMPLLNQLGFCSVIKANKNY